MGASWRDLVDSSPVIHPSASSGAHAVPLEALERLDGLLQPGMKTLETGAGWTTLVFAAAGTVHTSVVPVQAEVDAILRCCSENGVSTEQLTFVVEFSQRALPQLPAGEVDVVVLDGGHGFPTAIIDYAYAAERLRLGGVLVVDDVHLWSVGILDDYLRHSPAWEQVGAIGFTTFYRRLADDIWLEWADQPCVRERTLEAERARAAEYLRLHEERMAEEQRVEQARLAAVRLADMDRLRERHRRRWRRRWHTFWSEVQAGRLGEAVRETLSVLARAAVGRDTFR